MKKMTFALVGALSLSNCFAAAIKVKDKVNCTTTVDYEVYENDFLLNEVRDEKRMTEATRTIIREGNLELRTVVGAHTSLNRETGEMEADSKYSSLTKSETLKDGEVEIVKNETSVISQMLRPGRSYGDTGLSINHNNFKTELHYVVSGNSKTLVKEIQDGKETGNQSSIDVRVLSLKKRVEITTLLAPFSRTVGDYKIKTTKSNQTCLFTEI